jgi:hypothetical protein
MIMNDTLKDECSLSPFDAAEFLDTPKAQSELLIDAFQSGNSAYIAHAFKIIARARGLLDHKTHDQKNNDTKIDISILSAMAMIEQLDLKLSLSTQ